MCATPAPHDALSASGPAHAAAPDTGFGPSASPSAPDAALLPGTSPVPRGTLTLAPQIVVAESAGACFGVMRALDLVREAAASVPGHVRTLGPLIHNPLVVAELADEGVGVVESPAQAAGETLVLRTHGVTPEDEAEARARCAAVIDATCPFVKRAHHAAERLSREGYQVIVVGEAQHAEAIGTARRAEGARIVATPDDLASLQLTRKVGVVAQTTMTHEALRAVVDALLPQVSELRVFDTICDATSERQAAATALASRADVMVVVGGKSSANTRHLAELCSARCPRTHHIEAASELDSAWLAGAQLIGVTAGASTPTAHIDAVVSALRALTC